MSHSDRHGFQPLSKDSKPLTGQRLSRLISKAAKDGTRHSHLQESLCVSIPFISPDAIEAHTDALIPHILNMLQGAQDALIRDIRMESGHNEVSDAEIDVAACIRFLDESASGGRITSEYLADWFNENYGAIAAEYVGKGMKFSDDMDQWSADQVRVVEQKCNVLMGMFTGFSSGKYSPDIPKCKVMAKFGAFVGVSADARMSGYLEKAAKIQKAKEEEMSMDALGF